MKVTRVRDPVTVSMIQTSSWCECGSRIVTATRRPSGDSRAWLSNALSAIAGFTALAVFAAGGLTALLTFRPDAIQEPHYTGLLKNAPAVLGDARRIATRYEEYREQLQRMVANVRAARGTA